MLSPGTPIDGRYEIIDAVGSGGMGHVYRARRIHLGDDVAITVMRATPDTPPESRDRFLRKSRACAQLRHPNNDRAQSTPASHICQRSHTYVAKDGDGLVVAGTSSCCMFISI